MLLIDGCIQTQHEARAQLEAELQCNSAAAWKGPERRLLKIALGGNVAYDGINPSALFNFVTLHYA